MINVEKKISLIDDRFNDHHFVMSMDGARGVLGCPHHPPAVVPHPVLSGQQVMVNRGCGSWCGLLRIEFSENNVASVVQGCSSDLKRFNVLSISDKTTENPPENKSGIILT